ncbi:peptide/nickel transport system substrate-binding protein [Actinopolymorpha singaporensis]|uniref:Peptide/nickel transport system substrate-binding protein n=2 Tax=Actinopolymorpha singaporensis TaxID=117157 RepID=A0A1H1U1F5_9ACTN|nr:peptide/nickel transport system substrate-binding protein [Actinopolymorpha singaporensis]
MGITRSPRSPGSWLEHTVLRPRQPRGRQRQTSRLSRGLQAVLAAIVIAAAAAACTDSPTASNAAKGNTTAPDTVLVMGSASPWTAWGYNPWSTNLNFPSSAGGFIFLPLAIQNWPSLDSFTPQLAQSWSVDGRQLQINLQPKATWQDGTPVTSKDVVDTLYLDALTQAGIWNDITEVTAKGAKSVVLTARPGIPMVLVKNDLFNGVMPYPSSVWGKYVTPELKQAVDSYFTQARTDPAAAAESPAYKKMTSALQNLAKVHPKTLVGDGPYKLVGMTTQEQKLAKWDGFYAADKITIKEIRYLGNQQPQVNSNLLSGTADFSSGWLYMPSAIVGQWLQNPDAHLLSVPGTFQGQIVFNGAKPPFNSVKVRQAMAYALPRQKMDELAWGKTKPHAVAPSIPEGLVDQVAQQFLTKDQLASLNPYPYDTKKAAALLEEAGFRRTGGKWFTPDGKPFKVTLEMNSGWTDQIAAFKVADSALDSFGIDSTLSTVEGVSYSEDLHAGDFQVAAFCCTGGSPNPLLDFQQSPMGSANNFTATGSSAGRRGLGFGPKVNVPGLGVVNVPQELDKQVHQVASGPRMKELTWSWAQLVNQQVPYLEYADFANQIAFSTKKFKWPAESSPLWRQMTNGNYLVVVGQEKGEISPK